MENTVITRASHPELYRPGIIFTNAPYRKFFYHLDIITSHDQHMYWSENHKCPWLNVLSRHGIEIELS